MYIYIWILPASKMAAIERRMVPSQDSTSFAPFTSLAASLWPTFLPIFSSREEKRSRHARSTTDDDPLELYSRWRIIIRRNLWPESYLFRDHSRSSQRIRQFPPFSWITKWTKFCCFGTDVGVLMQRGWTDTKSWWLIRVGWGRSRIVWWTFLNGFVRDLVVMIGKILRMRGWYCPVIFLKRSMMYDSLFKLEIE